MKEKSIFITGISGCVGHYLYDIFLPLSEYKLFLLIRNPDRVLFEIKENHRLKVLHDRLENIQRYSDLLSEMDYVIHLASSWGGHRVRDINVNQTLNLLSSLNPDQCKKVILFSSASILNENNQPEPQVMEMGTPYIQSKYLCVTKLPELQIQNKIHLLYPTVILGGGKNHPLSHAAKELKKVWKYLPYIKYFRMDGSFHFIHAFDIAQIVRFLLNHQTEERSFVLGNPSISIDECIQQLCQMAGIRRKRSFDITPLALRFLPLLYKKRLSSWDAYSLKKRHFLHKTVNSSSFGLPSEYSTLNNCLHSAINEFL